MSIVPYYGNDDWVEELSLSYIKVSFYWPVMAVNEGVLVYVFLI